MVSNVQNKELKSTVEMDPEPSPPVSKTNSLPLKPTREDIHDHSENEENTVSKISLKNNLYEAGKYKLIFVMHVYMHIHA